MTTKMRDEAEKKAFRAGYECSCIVTLAVPSSPEESDIYKVRVNYLIRDIYIFLMHHNQSKEDIFGEYMLKCDLENDHRQSQLSPEVVNNAVTRVFSNSPEIAHAYFLSRICHFFLFGIRLNLTAMTSTISSSFDQLFSLHDKFGCWPYPLEMRDSLYTIYECFATNMWPPGTLIRHLYACLAEIYKISVNDLVRTVGSNLSALKSFYHNAFPEEFPEGRPDTVVFDDSVAFYEYLKNADPPLLNRYGHKSLLKAFLIEREYKRLSNLDKLKYVNLANSATSEEVNYVKLHIAPLFERRMVLKKGFLDAHRY